MVNALDLLHIKGTFIDGECVRFVAYKRYIYRW